jgi:hypothetical protein
MKERIKSAVVSKLKFFGRISTMGASKVIVYIPQGMHEEVLRQFKGKTIRIILEDAEEGAN